MLQAGVAWAAQVSYTSISCQTFVYSWNRKETDKETGLFVVLSAHLLHAPMPTPAFSQSSSVCLRGTNTEVAQPGSKARIPLPRAPTSFLPYTRACLLFALLECLHIGLSGESNSYKAVGAQAGKCRATSEKCSSKKRMLHFSGKQEIPALS